MKRFFVAVMLALTAVAAAQEVATKTIQDQGEYNAYTAATSQTSPAARAAALEAFVQQYPDTVVKEGALSAAMTDYQAAGNSAKLFELSGRVLQVNPKNLVALAVQVDFKRRAALAGQNAERNLAEAGPLAERGLDIVMGRTRPQSQSENDFAVQQRALKILFDGAIGHAALAAKDFEKAQKYLRTAIESNPTPDANDIYQLGLAYLGATPPNDEDILNGIWFMARLHTMVPTWDVPVRTSKYWYRKFHGSEEGWSDLVNQARASVLPPNDLAQIVTKYVPPTPCEQARPFIEAEPIEKMDFAKWIFLLSVGCQETADMVWKQLEGKTLPPFVGKVISASNSELTLAVTADGFEENKPEVTVAMAEPLRALPQVGANVQMQAVANSYDESPFLMKLSDGVRLDAPAAGKSKTASKTKTKRK